MMVKKNQTKGKVRLHERVAALVNISPKKQWEIANELGYEQPNIITMFKQGKTKIPINKVGSLALALGADPGHMTRLALQEYMPETYQAITDSLGGIVSKDERELLEIWREATNNQDPHLSEATKNGLRKLGEKNP